MYYCILDTTAALERYRPSSPKDKNFIDALFGNKKIGLFLPIVCVSEAIQQFYSAYIKDKISVKERTTLINRLRKDIKDEILFVYPSEDSLFARTKKIFNKSFSTPLRGNGGYIDMADMIVIATALDLIKDRKPDEEFCIITSDFHLYDTAIALGIKCFNSAIDNIELMPKDFCRRKHERKKSNLKVICKNLKTDTMLDRTITIDICEKGFRIEKKSIVADAGDIFHFTVSTYDKDSKEVYSGDGMVMWDGKDNSGTDIVGVEVEGNTKMSLI